MLLQKIVGALDVEMDRLRRIRDIVVKLGRGRDPIERFDLEQLAVTAPTVERPAERPAPKPRKAARPRVEPAERLRRRRERPGAASAFAKVIPSAPVVVSAATLHLHKLQAAAPAEPQPTPVAVAVAPTEAPDKMVRDLSQRWLSSR